MIARASQLFLPTLRDAPADAEAVSHKLLVRGGFVRQVSAGLWSYLPLGWKIHRKVEQIVREEVEAVRGPGSGRRRGGTKSPRSSTCPTGQAGDSSCR